MKKVNLLLFLLIGFMSFSQSKTARGKVVDNNNSPIPGANIILKGTNKGTITDFDGNFTLNVTDFPVIVRVSYVGYEPIESTISDSNVVSIVLKENSVLDDVVVTASRTSEKLKESPVAVERMGFKEIKNTSSQSFYDGLENIKGVQLNTNSLTFQSVNTRGFATFSNTRFVQLIDGMDNTSPALNFPLGNLIGMNELDVQSIEILPGASSALYGANAFNGILTMNSKNPFNYKGLSAYVKYGQTKQKAAGTNPYSDVGIRYAWGNNEAAAKINLSFLKGTDWYAVDNRDIDMDAFNNPSNPLSGMKKGSRDTNPSYDGMNIYGDEIATTIDMNHAFDGTPLVMLNRNEVVRISRTGYAERDLTDYKAESFKGDIAFHYRPGGQPGGLEFIWNTRIGTGKTIYQGANRYMLGNFLIHQHKLEIKNKNFFIRGYYTGEDAGDSSDSKFTAWNLNRKWLSDKDWFTYYLARYSIARAGILFDDATGYPAIVGGVPQLDPHGPYTKEEAHLIARQFADYGEVALGEPKATRLMPGTPEFEKALKEVTSDPDFKSGGKFIDKTKLKHLEGNYNFKNLIKIAEIQIGGSLRRFSLHSEGTIFTDYTNLDPINIDEAGAYLQLTKKILDNKLKLTTSVRYDKQKKFKGNFSPRFAAVYSVGEHREHNFRVSYQTGFRNPTTQDLYIGLNIGPVTLLGAAPDNPERYSEKIIGSTYPGGATILGTDAYNNAYTLSSFIDFATAYQAGIPLEQASKKLEVAKVNLIQPEQVSTVEIGYRGQLFEKFGIDFTGYYNRYNNFGAAQKVMALASEAGNVNDLTAMNAIGTKSYKPFYLYTNSKVPITSYGADIGFNYKINKFNIRLIYDYAKFYFDQDANPDFEPGFNTPEHKIKFSIANDNLYKRIGFRVDYKYQTEFLWQSSFANAMVPARSVLDAQVSYNIKRIKTRIKVGGTNLLGQEYMPAPGTGMIGSMYYIGLIFNN